MAEQVQTVKVELRSYVHEDLKELVGQHADVAGLPVSEYIAKLLAGHVGRPDLAEIPRKSGGRPRVKRNVAGMFAAPPSDQVPA